MNDGVFFVLALLAFGDLDSSFPSEFTSLANKDCDVWVCLSFFLLAGFLFFVLQGSGFLRGCFVFFSGTEVCLGMFGYVSGSVIFTGCSKSSVSSSSFV